LLITYAMACSINRFTISIRRLLNLSLQHPFNYLGIWSRITFLLKGLFLSLDSSKIGLFLTDFLFCPWRFIEPHCKRLPHSCLRKQHGFGLRVGSVRTSLSTRPYFAVPSPYVSLQLVRAKSQLLLRLTFRRASFNSFR